MKAATTLTLLALFAGTTAAFAIEPIKGSITYNGHVSRLPKSPPGSPVSRNFIDEMGNRQLETYLVQPDHTLKLVSRRQVDIPSGGR